MNAEERLRWTRGFGVVGFRRVRAGERTDTE
jgi:hypothetical protein